MLVSVWGWQGCVVSIKDTRLYSFIHDSCAQSNARVLSVGCKHPGGTDPNLLFYTLGLEGYGAEVLVMVGVGVAKAGLSFVLEGVWGIFLTSESDRLSVGFPIPLGTLHWPKHQLKHCLGQSPAWKVPPENVQNLLQRVLQHHTITYNVQWSMIGQGASWIVLLFLAREKTCSVLINAIRIIKYVVYVYVYTKICIHTHICVYTRI